MLQNERKKTMKLLQQNIHKHTHIISHLSDHKSNMLELHREKYYIYFVHYFIAVSNSERIFKIG